VTFVFTFLPYLWQKVKLSPCLSKHNAIKTYWGVVVQRHTFLTSALQGVEWLVSRCSRFTPGTHWIRGWVGPRAGVDAVKRKILSPPWESNSRTPIIQAVASHYTDWAIPALDSAVAMDQMRLGHECQQVSIIWCYASGLPGFYKIWNVDAAYPIGRDVHFLQIKIQRWYYRHHTAQRKNLSLISLNIHNTKTCFKEKLWNLMRFKSRSSGLWRLIMLW
jgi:hypothetical protein